jgi:hypothetical protein
MVDGQKLDGCHPELLKVVDGKIAGQAGVAAANLLGDMRAELRKALDMHLINYGLGKGDVWALVAAPIEIITDDHRFWEAGRVISSVLL